jgi:hypothetical protein
MSRNYLNGLLAVLTFLAFCACWKQFDGDEFFVSIGVSIIGIVVLTTALRKPALLIACWAWVIVYAFLQYADPIFLQTRITFNQGIIPVSLVALGFMLVLPIALLRSSDLFSSSSHEQRVVQCYMLIGVFAGFSPIIHHVVFQMSPRVVGPQSSLLMWATNAFLVLGIVAFHSSRAVRLTRPVKLFCLSRIAHIIVSIMIWLASLKEWFGLISDILLPLASLMYFVACLGLVWWAIEQLRMPTSPISTTRVSLLLISNLFLIFVIVLSRLELWEPMMVWRSLSLWTLIDIVADLSIGLILLGQIRFGASSNQNTKFPHSS